MMMTKQIVLENKEAAAMKHHDNIKPFPKRKRDLLDDLIEKGDTDEMGLLDLVFVEEILRQKNQEKAV
jgi:hypothetical protein